MSQTSHFLTRDIIYYVSEWFDMSNRRNPPRGVDENRSKRELLPAKKENKAIYLCYISFALSTVALALNEEMIAATLLASSFMAFVSRGLLEVHNKVRWARINRSPSSPDPARSTEPTGNGDDGSAIKRS